ncbi:hypothetical protein AB4Y88_05150 [Paenarthrobacter sp. RAF9]
MRKIAIVGAGESGAQLALGLQRAGYEVTLLSDRSAAQIRTGKVMSSQCMFSTALDAEAQMGTALTEFYESGAVPGIRSIRLHVGAEQAIEWEAPLDGPARSIDQRIKSALWIETFVANGGDFRIEKVTPRMLEELARDYELVIVSTGKGEIGQIFWWAAPWTAGPTSEAPKSSWNAPCRSCVSTSRMRPKILPTRN